MEAIGRPNGHGGFKGDILFDPPVRENRAFEPDHAESRLDAHFLSVL